MNNKPFAEIVESSLNLWKGQCWQWNYFPAFGSLVTIDTSAHRLFGIVYHVQTGSSDPIRQPYAYQKTEQELRQEQPQIFEFLQTTTVCLPVGFITQQKCYYQLPETPPAMHAFITHATAEDYQQFFAQPYYLHVLFGLSLHMAHIDELLLALLKHMNDVHLITHERFHAFIEQFSLLVGNDYRRLKLFLQRAEYLITLS